MQNEVPDRTRFHEAAHATVALALGVPVYRILIWREDDGLYAKTVHAPTTDDNQSLIAIAGMIGEALIFKTAAIAYGNGMDGDFIAGLKDHRQDELARQAAEILKGNWKRWTELADELKAGSIPRI